MLLRVTALAAAAAASAPPFVTATALRPARRAQDFEECPVLTKIKKDDCTDVKDFDALPVCSDPCLCKGMHCRAEVTEYCGSEDKGSGHHNCAAAASSFTPRNRPETELGTYSTYSDNVVKDADDPHRVDSNPIVDHAAGSEGDLDDVDIAPGGGDEY